MFVPSESLNKLRCSTCHKYLSHFPIYLSEGRTSVCGRCPQPPESRFIHDVVYEALAQNMKFPCAYHSEGCLENLVPADIPKHEKFCHYKVIKCPVFSNQCIWMGTCADVLDHCQEQHPATVLKDGEFEIDLLGSYKLHNIFFHNDEFFIVKREFDSKVNTFRYQVLLYGNAEVAALYNYQITLRNGANTHSWQLPSAPVAASEDEATIPVNVDDVKKQLDDPTIIIGKVSIKMPELDALKEHNQNEPNHMVNYDMLREMECPVCLVYMVPPIYQCVRGHSICMQCKEDVECCPSCREEIKNTKNFALERLANYLNYPCKYADYGCRFVAKPDKVEPHQKFCLFGSYSCPLHDYLDCSWKDTAWKINEHILEKHTEHYSDIDTISIFIDDEYIQKEDAYCFILKFAQRIFKLHYLYRQEVFYFALQLIGQLEDCKNFKFELDIQDLTNKNQRMFLRSHCVPMTIKDEAFQLKENYVYLKYDQIKTFITDTFSFRIRILK